MRTSTIALAMALACSCLLVLATAADPVEPSHKHKHHEYHEHSDDHHITLWADPSAFCDGVTGYPNLNCQETKTLTRNLYRTQGDVGDVAKAVAVLYQSGVVVKSGTQSAATTLDSDATADLARVLYQTSIRFTANSQWGESTIQAQGDGTGPQDQAYTNRAIIGGTGAFTGAKGYITRGGDPVTRTPGAFVLKFTHKDY